MKYRIVRHFMSGDRVTIKENLTLEEAKEHCSDPETSSTTCQKSPAKSITKANGPWFDAFEGYDE